MASFGVKQQRQRNERRRRVDLSSFRVMTVLGGIGLTLHNTAVSRLREHHV
jgi:hypothetical protein